MLRHPGHGPIRGVLLLVSLQLLLCIGDVATDAAVEGVGHQLHPVVQCLVPHVKLLCSKPHSQHPMKKQLHQWKFLHRQQNRCDHSISVLVPETWLDRKDMKYF